MRLWQSRSLKIFKSLGGYIEIPQLQEGSWVNVTNPTEEEISQLKNQFKIPDDIIHDILDIDERPRIEYDDDWTLIILRIPIQNQQNGVPFHTIPLGLFIANNYYITICSSNNEVLPSEQPSLYREQYHNISDEINFIFKLFLRSANVYLKFLKQINQQTTQIEYDLEKSVRNEELNKLLKMEKCLVYFITSLKSNDIVMVKLRNSKKNVLSETNEDLIEDALIENKQAIEMAQIYSDIQSGLMDAFASVISNNLNVMMKRLTSISIILMIPTLIASIYGMNIINYFENSRLAFPIILGVSFIMSLMGYVVFRRKNWF